VRTPAPRPRRAKCTGRWWDFCTPTLPGQVWGCGDDRRTPTRSLVLRQAPRKFKGRLLELRARDAPVAALAEGDEPRAPVALQRHQAAPTSPSGEVRAVDAAVIVAGDSYRGRLYQRCQRVAAHVRVTPQRRASCS
jgi:hypothetical protein